jgi:hypothetical protein
MSSLKSFEFSLIKGEIISASYNRDFIKYTGDTESRGTIEPVYRCF